MTLKWNRETVLVIIMSIMLLIGGFYYGNLYLVDPLKEEASTITDTVDAEQSLLVAYPPNEELYSEYEAEYIETEGYLPQTVEANREFVTLEQLAAQSNVTIDSLTRIEERQAIEELTNDFLKNAYTVEMTSDSPVNFRQLLKALTDEERVWNVTAFSYNRSGEESYTGSFNYEWYYLNDEK